MLIRALVLVLLLPGLASAGGIAAARTLPAGSVLSADDLAPGGPSGPGLTDPAEAIGLQTRVTIYEGRPILAAHLRAPVLVARNQIVRLTFRRGGLSIEAEGRALGEGAAGDTIRIMNTVSRSTLFARVNIDGTVSVAN